MNSNWGSSTKLRGTSGDGLKTRLFGFSQVILGGSGLIAMVLLVVPKGLHADGTRFSGALGMGQPVPSVQVELVQTVPLETTLADPSLRHAKDAWIELFRQAKRSISMAQFYLSNEPGEALEPVLEELEKAGARGVKIKVLVSNRLLSTYQRTFDRIKAIPNVTARVFDLSRLTGGILHAKYFIVDGEKVFLGSQNFDWRALSHIHELGFLITHRAIAQNLGRIFDADWGYSLGPHLANTVQVGIPAVGFSTAGQPSNLEIVASPAQLNPRGIRPAIDRLVSLIDGASQSISVQLLKYSPVESYRGRPKFWNVIDSALRRASTRGVRVRLLVSHWNQKKPHLVHLQNLNNLPNIEVRVATIPTHSSGEIPFSRVIHSKYMVVDRDTTWLGTSNWSADYFEASRNVEIVYRQPSMNLKITRVFDRLWNSAYSKNVSGLQPIGR